MRETTRRPFVSVCSHFPNRPDKIHVVALTISGRNGRLSIVQHGGNPKEMFDSRFARVFGIGEGRDFSVTKEE